MILQNFVNHDSLFSSPSFSYNLDTHTTQINHQSLKQIGDDIEKQILDHFGVGNLLYSSDITTSHITSNENHLKLSKNTLHQLIPKKPIQNLDHDHDEKVSVHTLSTQYDKDKPNLVFIHGYWSSSLSFVKMIKPLKEKFNIHLIDLPGQALSSRVPFEFEKNEDMISFFIDNIEEWRKNMFKNDKIYLAGHSFGGFLAGHYATKYEKNLEQLYLISPFGIYDDGNKESVNNSVIYYTFKESSDSAREDTIMKMPVSSERCMTSLLKFPQFTAFNPLEKQIQKLKIPVHFFYGQDDWMEKDTAKQLLDSNKMHSSSYNIIENSSHNIQFENPDGLAQKMLQLGGFE